MRSPGRPEPSCAVQRAFWSLTTDGVTTEDVAAAVGASTPVATRWFHDVGGMPPISLAEPTGQRDAAEPVEFPPLRPAGSPCS